MSKLDFFEDWYSYYQDFDKFKNPIPRPQPIDFVINFFEGKKKGFFVDVGAYDGVTWSNSLFLEKNFDWEGICIEPIPKAYENLIQIRKANCINSAICNFDGETNFLQVTGYAEMLSGLVDSMNEDHLNRINKEISAYGGSKSLYPLKVQKLQTIFDEFNINEIDYLSIDVECGELNVLKSIDWNKTNIKLISCEINQYFRNNNEIDKFLFNFCYKNIGRICGDEFYVKF